MAFHEVRFPAGDLARRHGGPERRTEIVVLGSGAEERNSRWADSQAQLQRGLRRQARRRSPRGDRLLRGAARAALRLSLARTGPTTNLRAGRRRRAPLDQAIGTGDGATADVPARQDLRLAPTRPGRATIKKPVAGTVRRGGGRRGADRGHGFRRRCRDRHRHVPRRGTSRRRARRSPPASSSTCRCASTPTSSRSICSADRGGQHPAHPHRGDEAVRSAPPGCKPISTTGATTLCWCWRITRNDGVDARLHRPRPRSSPSTARGSRRRPASPATEMRGSVGLNVDNARRRERAHLRPLERGRPRRRPLRQRA